MNKTLDFEVVNVNSFIDKEIVNIKEVVTEGLEYRHNSLNLNILAGDPEFGALKAGDVVNVTISK